MAEIRLCLKLILEIFETIIIWYLIFKSYNDFNYQKEKKTWTNPTVFIILLNFITLCITQRRAIDMQIYSLVFQGKTFIYNEGSSVMIPRENK